jgi:DNA-binding NarL/FixJ family response regulator
MNDTIALIASTCSCMHDDNNKNTSKIEERRRQVASMLAQTMTETEIAEQLSVDYCIISRDVMSLEII